MKRSSINYLQEKVCPMPLHCIAGFSGMQYFGIEGDFNVMVIDLLGKSLEDIFADVCEKQFSLKTTMMVAL